MIAVYICAAVAFYAAARTLAEKNTLLKLPFLNVLNFAIAGLIALLMPAPAGLLAAAAYFIGATLESNAIASTIAKRSEE
ncbi:MAG: DUF2109 family protein [Methanomicrobium sp.]|nr:DUF2109 family protein [Methanomicrobium sp.]